MPLLQIVTNVAKESVHPELFDHLTSLIATEFDRPKEFVMIQIQAVRVIIFTIVWTHSCLFESICFLESNYDVRWFVWPSRQRDHQRHWPFGSWREQEIQRSDHGVAAPTSWHHTDSMLHLLQWVPASFCGPQQVDIWRPRLDTHATTCVKRTV